MIIFVVLLYVPTERIVSMIKIALRYTPFYILLGLLISFVAPVYAASFVVNTTADSNDGSCGTPCSLRDAITAANIAGGTNTITFSVSGTITLGSNLPQITKDLTITGPGASQLTINGHNHQPFNIHSGVTASLSGMTIENGRATAGGAILNAGTLTVSDSTITSNTATLLGGGGIANTGSVTITDSTITSNSATLVGGGGISNTSSVTLTDTTVSGNSAPSGGGIYSLSGTVTITGGSFSTNSSTGVAGSGGGINSSSGTVTVTGVTFSTNTTKVNGGGIYNLSGSLTVTGSTFSDNTATGLAGNGGGIASGVSATLTVSTSTFTDNSATLDGGGIRTDGLATVSDSTFDGNEATDGLGSGGGIYNLGYSLTVTGSTFSNNSAGLSGGGISNADDLTVINSTFAANSSAYGGGIANATLLGSSDATIVNSTLSGNSASSSGGGLYTNNKGLTTVNNSIIANSTSGSDCSNDGSITVQYSLVKDGSCGTTNGVDGNIVGLDPLLGALGDNGGLTETMALLSGSPAIDAGSNALAVDASSNPLTTDQTGNARISNSIVDMGAFEFQLVPVTEEPIAAASISGAPISDLCANVTALANGAITVSGGVQNVLLNGVYGNTYCRLIAADGSYITSPAEIGVSSVISLGVVDAVDVFGQLPGGDTVVPFVAPVTVCLRGSGDVLFLSAADASRTPQHLAATASGGFTCVSVPNSGTVVLVGSSSNIPETQPSTPAPATTTLTDCQVTTTNAPINLRAEPDASASVIAQLPYNLMLTATAYQSGWYQVIYLDGQGWVSAQFLSTTGNCGS